MKSLKKKKESMVFRSKIVSMFIIVFGGLPFLLSGCEDNPVGSEGWDHAPAVGFELEMEGEVLLSYFLRQYEFNPSGFFEDYVMLDDGIQVGGMLVLKSKHLDSETMHTPYITIHYLDEDRNRIQIPSLYLNGKRNPEGEWNLDFEFFEPGSRSVRLSPEERPFGVIYDKTEDTWSFSIEAHKNGRADLRINLFHLDHSDMAPIPLPVKIKLD
ncbi:hypothetical protein QLX67_09815 [Balneolaceae bacterium ANBcel3]|nr:hypothetical protein [Balneolaceae bacterium ANBcel3]